MLRSDLGDDCHLRPFEERDADELRAIGSHPIDWEQAVGSVGYWLAADAQGRGIATRAVAAYLDHAFGPWGLRRMEIRAAVDNLPSRAIAERLGFTHEGTLRGLHLVRGVVQDVAVYGLLAQEWRGISAPAAP